MKLIDKHSIINLKHWIRHEMFGFDTENKILNQWNENMISLDLLISEMKIWDKTQFLQIWYIGYIF